MCRRSAQTTLRSERAMARVDHLTPPQYREGAGLEERLLELERRAESLEEVLELDWCAECANDDGKAGNHHTRIREQSRRAAQRDMTDPNSPHYTPTIV